MCLPVLFCIGMPMRANTRFAPTTLYTMERNKNPCPAEPFTVVQDRLREASR